MPDMVIARMNALGTDQPEQIIFTDRRGRPMGDVEIPGVMDFEEEDDDDAVMPVLDPVGIDGVELPGVDIAGQAPQTVEIDDLDIPQPDPPLIETVEEPTVPLMEQDEPTQVAQPMQTAGLRRSTRVKIQPKLAVRTNNDRFEVLLCRNAAGDPWRPTPRLAYVHSRRFLPV
jgi:hypothetical protein